MLPLRFSNMWQRRAMGFGEEEEAREKASEVATEATGSNGAAVTSDEWQGKRLRNYSRDAKDRCSIPIDRTPWDSIMDGVGEGVVGKDSSDEMGVPSTQMGSGQQEKKVMAEGSI
ncbi:hypothetical protein BHM03_00057862 [Ensete ventricosum]|nr:hypothetical protein BHM03_00057862 [Ensete ventricosum]